jgi:hypothetical protein
MQLKAQSSAFSELLKYKPEAMVCLPYGAYGLPSLRYRSDGGVPARVRKSDYTAAWMFFAGESSQESPVSQFWLKLLSFKMEK